MELILEFVRAGVLVAIYGRFDTPPRRRHQVQRFIFRATMLAGYLWAWFLLLAERPPSTLAVLGVIIWALFGLGLVEVEWELGNKGIVWTACLLGAGLGLALLRALAL